MGDHLFFHTSGAIISQPAATDDEVTELLRLARRVADTSSSATRIDVLNRVIGAFYDSVMANVLATDDERHGLRAIATEAEDTWIAINWAGLPVASGRSGRSKRLPPPPEQPQLR